MPQREDKISTRKEDSGAGSRSGQIRSVRQLALEAMTAVMDNGEYCDKVLLRILEQQTGLDRRDRAFLMRLVEGTIERCVEIDYVIDRYSKLPVASRSRWYGRSCVWRSIRSCIWIRCRTVQRVTKRSGLPARII